MKEIIDDVLRLPRELGAKLRVLGRDADRAGIQVALAHEDAARSDERRGGEAELLGPQERRDRDIASGLEAAVGLELHPSSKPVQHECLVGLGQTELPRSARVLDGRQR